MGWFGMAFRNLLLASWAWKWPLKVFGLTTKMGYENAYKECQVHHVYFGRA